VLAAAGPLLDNVDLVSLDDNVLLDNVRPVLLGKMAESNGIAEDILPRCNRRRHSAAQQHGLLVVLPHRSDAVTITAYIQYIWPRTIPNFHLPSWVALCLSSAPADYAPQEPPLKPSTKVRPPQRDDPNVPEKIEAASNELLAVAKLFSW